MKSLLLILFTASCLCFAAGHEPCTTPDEKQGMCVPLMSCQSLFRMLLNSSQSHLTFLTKSLCGNTTPAQVCCPPVDCTNPDGEQGTCVELNSCPHMADLVQSYTEVVKRRYLRRHSCEGLAQGSVCCVTQKTPRNHGNCQLTALPPDPSSECCGVDARAATRIIGGDATSIEEYPWLALLEYTEKNVRIARCGGVLISGQYVLTAGHCVTPRKPIRVRLGEYDTDNSGQDCVPAAGGGKDCTDGAVSVPIKSIVIHPEYVRNYTGNDIALIQLTRIVQFTDFIRPICMPVADFTMERADNVDLYTTGWGKTETGQSSNIKLKVRLPYVTREDCQSAYNSFTNRVTISEEQICAGGEYGMDSCGGDSGGPLMRKINIKHDLVGITSFGPEQCGSNGIAGVYTKVFHYLPWIRSHITA